MKHRVYTWAVLMAIGLVALLPARAQYAVETGGPIVHHNRIDDFVFDRLKAERIPPSPTCTDAVFIRRIYLDMTGRLPTGQEARDFIRDDHPFKRRELIDRLFETEAFADYWAMKWCDILRVKAEFPSNLWPNAVQAYHRWLRTAIKENLPYDEMARTMLTASGSNFRDPPVNFYRAVKKKQPSNIAQAAALTFMGIRYERLPEDRQHDLANFFAFVGYKRTAEWKEEIVYFDLVKAATNQPDLIRTRFPDGRKVKLDLTEDPRRIFADWLIQPDNPYFSKAAVNRIWFWLMGRGLIHEPDDIRPDNPPTHPELLAWLERELETHEYDTRHVYRLILNSSTYQRSSIPLEDNREDDTFYSHYRIRRLEAEALIDALNQLTYTTEEYSSQIPEPFTFIPEEMGAVQIADGSITSSFLDMFGRPPRASGALTERDNSPSDTQILHLLNSSHIQRKIYGRRLTQHILKKVKWSVPKAINRVYLHILSRPPTGEEQWAAKEYVENTPDLSSSQALGDIAWALINSKEFLYRH